MKLKKNMLVAAAFLMIGAAGVAPTMAYFTDTKEVTGGVLVSLGDSELTPHDSAEGLLKTVAVENTSQYDAFVRVKAIYSENFNATITEEAKANGWSVNEDGYYYYSDILAAGETSKELKLQIEVKDETIADQFNVVIVEEATKVIYDAEGNTRCDWNSKVMTSEEYDAKFSNNSSEQEQHVSEDNIENKEGEN
ncbi:MAG: hypothetical protein IJR96_02215 [Pseudobutyrivibrio sp.]|nr:hypothetical protein [Pseudobutyrivibrio sp.]